MKKYKYKREHFSCTGKYLRFKERVAVAQKKWVSHSEENNPEKRERRLLRQKLYSRYYRNTNVRKTFVEWLHENFGISNVMTMPLEDLRIIAK